MNLLKITKTCLLFILLGTSLGYAQSQQAGLSDQQKEQMTQQLAEFVEVLDLSDAQRPEFEAIARKYGLKMKTVKDEGGSKWSMYRKVRSIRKDRNAEMKALLSKDQYALYLDKQKELEKKMKEKRG